MDELLAQVLSTPNGARFYRVDFHNHTPHDPAFHCGGLAIDTDEEKAEFAREYVRHLKETQQLEIVGITEHNDVSWLPYIQAAAQEAGLVVFPGIELGANDGKRQVHFLALFNPGTAAGTLDHFISSLGLLPDERFHPDGTPKLVDLDCRSLTNRIVSTSPELRGIPIAAHASSKNGLFHELEGESRVLAYRDPHLLAVEIPAGRDVLNDFERALVNGEQAHYDNKAVACLNHSDGRGLVETHPGCLPSGSRFSHIKLSTLSVEALRQAFIDFDSRIRLEGEDRAASAPRLLGLVVDGPQDARFLGAAPRDGAVDPFVLHFNPNLNTLIGGRGTGKSSVIEALRYGLALEPRTVATQAQSRQIADTTLRAGTRVTIFYEMADGTRYQITRRKGSEPEVYDVATGESRAVAPARLLPGGAPVEVYGQKEIYEISTNVEFQLNLLDTYIAEPLGELLQQDADLVRWLATNAADIQRLQDDVDQAGQRLQELEAVRLELERMERHQAAAQLEHKKLAEREKALLDRAEQAVQDRLAALAEFGASLEPLQASLPGDLAAEDLPHAAQLTAQATLLQRIDEESTMALSRLEARTLALWAEGQDQRRDWRAEYDQVQADYEALLHNLGGDFSSERYFAQQARLQALEGIKRETERREQQLTTLRQERKARLHELRRLRRSRVYRLRKAKARELTDELSGALRVTVACEGNRQAYAERLTELFAGRNINKAVVEQLSTATFTAVKGTREASHHPDPIHLAQAIRCERTSPPDNQSLLAALYGISSAYRRRLAAIEDETLFQLEAFRIPDLPDISLEVGGQYRSLTPSKGQPGLSTGQKCTAILSLILVERNAPLVIDQPEDDLDNEFIYREIVRTLRREKERRQFIIATHNANIPVSGDAELILAMHANQSHGWIEHAGSIDDPQMRKPVEDILEGGKEAFEFRQKKYGILE